VAIARLPLPLVLGALVGLAGFSLGCDETPSLTFDADDASDDGTVAPRSDASPGEGDAEATGDDAGDDVANAAPIDDLGDDGGGDAAASCGNATVANCAMCPGAHVQCAAGNKRTCVSDCAQCSPGWLACVHCAGDTVLAKCVALNNKGVLPCTAAGKCACDDGGVAACPSVPGAAQVCSGAGKQAKCVTCGEAKSSGAACLTSSGASGTCSADGNAAPSCD
jgi:hypothetical protein